jgi:sugar phosphate isomerase/epimerase
MNDRRSFLGLMGMAASAGILGTLPAAPVPAAASKQPWFSISLAEWSYNRSLFAKKITNLDFPVMARRDYGIDVVEYVNTFFKDKAEDQTYLAELKKRCDDNGVRSGLIMCDGEGAIGDADPAARTKAVENHYKWVTAAKYLGCHSIRVNAQSTGTWGAQLDNATDGLRRLGEFGAQQGLNVIVENHGGTSSHGKWLALVIERVGLPNVGTLPDFGNFTIEKDKQLYDRYLGVQELMPFAKGVSAKSYAFDAKGEETTIDYKRILTVVRDAGYRGYVGIEFEGRGIEEDAGIRATKTLLERVRTELQKGA